MGLNEASSHPSAQASYSIIMHSTIEEGKKLKKVSKKCEFLRFSEKFWMWQKQVCGIIQGV